MSDMSLPPLSLVPLDLNVSALPAAASAGPSLPTAQPFAWPSPVADGYPAATPQTEPEPCEIESTSGKVSAGRLVDFDADAALVSLNIPPARSVLTLGLTQFRRLTLRRLLAPRTSSDDGDFDQTAPLLPRSRVARWQLRFRDRSVLSIDSLDPVDTPLGLFTFTPVDGAGELRRSLFPRPLLVDFEREPGGDEPAPQRGNAASMSLDELPGARGAAPARPLAEMLLGQEIARIDQLTAAIEHQATMPMVRIGEALLALGMIDEARLAEALRLQKLDRSLPLGEMLVRRGDVSRPDLQTALARKMGYPMVDVGVFPTEPDAVLRLPLAAARRLPALPLLMLGGRLVVALEDPSLRNVIDEIEFAAQCKVVPVLARAGTLAAAVERVYSRLGQDGHQPALETPGALSGHDGDGANSANKLLANLEQQQASDLREDDTPIEQSDNSLVRLINTMILEARQQGVSDIHIECQPGRDKVRVRFRRDGVLKPYIELPHTYRSALVARIKIMCDLDISERRKPQDGKINFGRWMQGQRLELRVATIPTANGLEDVVMRLLASARTMPLDGMGLQADTLAQLKSVIERPYGLVLCVGPTGSGKTTTLHAALGHINTPARKIWTAEDPVEITQAGLRQVQVNPKIGWTFANALRAFLRADPDVVMVGEIRDGETAQMAVEASLTGHLVLSTLHTNSAPETVTRLLDMGMDPFSFADSLLAVLAQRLIRRLCKHCATHRPASDDEIEALLDEYLIAYPDEGRRPDRTALRADWITRHGAGGMLRHHHAPGCPQCDNSGFGGRVGLHELLVVSREVRRMIQTRARAEELQALSMHEGTRTLRQDGIIKTLAGLTTIEEVRAISNA